jgi:DNA-binding FrmR family transcriptional regulator
MIEDERYCIDIVTQIKAVRASLRSVEKKIINEHLDHCVIRAVNSKNATDANKVLEEVRELLNSRQP